MYAVLLSLIQLILLRYYFHQSSVYLSKELFLINPISIDANHYFLHSNFYFHNELVESTKLLFNYIIIFVIPASIEVQDMYVPFSLSSLRLQVMEMDTGSEMYGYCI